MPKSGNKANPGLTLKLDKSTKTFRTMAPEDLVKRSDAPKPDCALMEPAEARVERALWKLGVDRTTWERSPEITPMLWATHGNQRKAVDLLRFSKDPDVVKFLFVYDEKLTQDDRERLPLEIPCIAAGVSPFAILGQIVMATRDMSRMESALIAMIKNPDVLRASADYGINKPENVKDRENLLKMTGSLPSSQGSSININFAKPDDADHFDIEDSNLESDVFHHDTKTIDDWGDRRRRLMDGDKQ